MDSLFQSVGTGHGGLTSFHASAPKGALTRMRGNKISEGELALLWFTVHSAVYQVGGRNVRRVSNVSEVVQDKEGRVCTRTMFRHGPFARDASRRFVEDAPLDESARYREAAAVCGIEDRGPTWPAACASWTGASRKGRTTCRPCSAYTAGTRPAGATAARAARCRRSVGTTPMPLPRGGDRAMPLPSDPWWRPRYVEI